MYTYLLYIYVYISDISLVVRMLASYKSIRMKMSSRCGIHKPGLRYRYSTKLIILPTASTRRRLPVVVKKRPNIADSPVTQRQRKSNTCNDAAVVRDHVTLRATFGFQPQTGRSTAARTYPTVGQSVKCVICAKYLMSTRKSTIVHQTVADNVT